MLELLLATTGMMAIDADKVVWPTNDLFPPDALQEGVEGVTRIRLIPASGDTPMRCETIRSSGDVRLDRAACAIVLPRVAALGSLGEAVKIKVKWYITEGESHTNFGGAVPFEPVNWIQYRDMFSQLTPGYPPSAHETRLDFDIAADGSISACRVVEASANKNLDHHFCNLLIRRAAFLPAIDSGGAAKPTTGTIIIGWSVGKRPASARSQP